MNEQPRRSTLSLNRNAAPPVPPKPKKEKAPKPPKEPKPPKIPYALQMLGHDADVQRYIDNNLSITLMLLSGLTFSGVVINGDRYAMTLLIDGIPYSFFKHAIEYYFPTSKEDI